MKEDMLPEGWEETTIEKVGKVITGKTPSTKDKSNFDGKIPFVKPNDLDKNGFIYTTTQTLSEKGAKCVATLPKNSLMVTCIGNLGKVGITTANITATNQQINSIIPFESVDYKYLYFQLLTLKDWLETESSATTISIINKSKFSKAPIILPDYKEQQYLSQKLTALLDEVAQTKQRLEAIPALLKQFRQSVLADAVSGRLTEEWRENKEYELIDKLTFPKGWMKSTLGKEFNYGSCKKKSPDEILNQDWVLELEDIEKDNSNILNKITNATRQAQSTKNVFKKGDVLYGKLRPYLNKIVIADGDGVCTTEIIPISSNERICNQYLFYWLKSPYFFNYVNEITYGVNMPRLGTQDGKKAIIVFPPKEEQTQIVQKVETYFALADEIETQVKAALENVNLLTQSILAKAFSGELSAAWRTQQAVKN